MIRFLILLSILSSTLLAEEHSISLQIGETRWLKDVHATNVRLSKKGVVDLQRLQEGWFLAALKLGVVTMRWFEPESAAERMVVVKVIKSSRSYESLKNHCRTLGVKCRQGGLVAGEVSDLFLWLRIGSACAADPGCRFRLRLAGGALGQLRDLLGSPYEVEMRWGRYFVTVPCGGSTRKARISVLDTLLGGAVSANFVTFRCQHLPSFLLRMKAVLASSRMTESLGIDVEKWKSWIELRNLKDTASSDLVIGQVGEQSHIVGEPSIVLALGQKASIRNGGEFQVSYESVEGERKGWKQHGFEFEVCLTEFSRGRVTIDYDVHWRVPAQQRQLNVNRMKSTAVVGTSEQYLLGITRVDSHQSSLRGLASLPIIGPLLRNETKRQSDVFLLLWAQVDHLAEKLSGWPAIVTNQNERG